MQKPQTKVSEQERPDHGRSMKTPKGKGEGIYIQKPYLQKKWVCTMRLIMHLGISPRENVERGRVPESRGGERLGYMLLSCQTGRGEANGGVCCLFWPEKGNTAWESSGAIRTRNCKSPQKKKAGCEELELEHAELLRTLERERNQSGEGGSFLSHAVETVGTEKGKGRGELGP